MSSERTSSTQTMNSDHDEYNSSISVDSRACSSMVGLVGSEQAKAKKDVKGVKGFKFWLGLAFGKCRLEPNLNCQASGNSTTFPENIKGQMLVSRNLPRPLLCANHVIRLKL